MTPDASSVRYKSGLILERRHNWRDDEMVLTLRIPSHVIITGRHRPRVMAAWFMLIMAWKALTVKEAPRHV